MVAWKQNKEVNDQDSRFWGKNSYLCVLFAHHALLIYLGDVDKDYNLRKENEVGSRIGISHYL